MVSGFVPPVPYALVTPVNHGTGLRLSALPRPPPPVNKTVTELTDPLIASYARAGGINHLDGVNLPSKSAVALIAEELL